MEWVLVVLCALNAGDTGGLIGSRLTLRHDQIVGVSVHPKRKDCAQLWLTGGGKVFIEGSPLHVLQELAWQDVRTIGPSASDKSPKKKLLDRN